MLAGLAAERGAALLAAEKQPHRAGLVAKALAGNPGPYQVIAADGTRPPWLPGTFDRVLTGRALHGSGALRRRPEAGWRRRPEDLDGFAPLQRGLLRTALDSVRVGGVVGYATCSPHLAETRAVVNDVLEHYDTGSAELLDARPPARCPAWRRPRRTAVAASARYGRHVSASSAALGATSPSAENSPKAYPFSYSEKRPERSRTKGAVNPVRAQ